MTTVSGEAAKLAREASDSFSNDTKELFFMIVVMQAHTSDEKIEHVMTFLKDHGLSGHLSQGVERTIIGVLGAVGPSGTRSTAGGLNPSISEALECLPGVEQVLIVSKPLKVASSACHP